MSREYKIFIDTSADISIESLNELELGAVPFPVTIGDTQFIHYGDYREMSFNEFYKRLKAGEDVSTAQINMNTYMETFKPVLDKGMDILYIGFSSGMSGTLQSANLAVQDLREEYPDRKIFIVDSLGACSGLGLLGYHAAMKKRDGLSIEDVRDWVEDNKMNMCFWFKVEDLNHLHKGGRLSKTAAIAGTMLQIKPILHITDEGKLEVVDKVRGKKKVYSKLIEHFRNTAINPEEQMVFIGQADAIEEAEEFRNVLLSEMKIKNVQIHPIGPVLGAHVGVGMLSIFFLGTHR